MAKNKKHETVNINSKDLVILRFPSEWPVNEADLQAMMKTVRTAINQDSTIVKRFVCMAKGMEIENVVYVTRDNIEKTVEGHVLDELGLNKICCRRHMLTHVDLD